MKLLQQIEAYLPETEQEESVKRELIRLIQQYDQAILTRECEAGHITCSGLVLSPDLKKALMAYHLIYKSVGWLGGHADGDEDLKGVALREVQEESSIKNIYFLSRKIISIDALPVQAHQKNGKFIPEHMHYNITYGFIAPENQPIAEKPDENQNIQWVEIKKIPEVCTEKHMIPIYEKIISRMKKLTEEKQSIPEQIKSPLLEWYPEHHRDLPWRKDKIPYHIWVSEIMLQQTRVEAVKGYYERFLKALPGIQDLAECPEDQLMKLWEGLGYYSRVRNMQKSAKIIMQEYQGRFPEEYKNIRSLPGIGEYTAGAISSICFGQPEPAVDGNVLRVMARLEEDYRNILDQQVKAAFTSQLRKIYDQEHAGMLTQALIEIGATVCIPKGIPDCENCPLKAICMAYQNQTVELLPVREKKQKRRTEYKTVFVLQYEDQIALRKRPQKGLLAGLWELPNVDGELTPEACIRLTEAWNVHPEELIKINQRRHIFTHITWEMQGVFLKCQKASSEFIWGKPEEFALPTAFRCILS